MSKTPLVFSFSGTGTTPFSYSILERDPRPNTLWILLSSEYGSFSEVHISHPARFLVLLDVLVFVLFHLTVNCVREPFLHSISPTLAEVEIQLCCIMHKRSHKVYRKRLQFLQNCSYSSIWDALPLALVNGISFVPTIQACLYNQVLSKRELEPV